MASYEFVNVEKPLDEPLVDFGAFFKKLFRSWLLILSSLSIAIICAFLVNRYSIPVYMVNTSAIIKAPKEASNAVSELLYGQELFGRLVNLENEAFLLKSHGLIEKTLRNLKLNVSYYHKGQVSDTEIYGKDNPIKVQLLSGPGSFLLNKPITCTVLDDATYQLSSKVDGIKAKITSLLKPTDPILASLENKTFSFGETVLIGNTQIIVLFNPNNYKDSYGKEFFFTIQNYTQLARRYRNKIQISPLSPESSILNINLETVNKSKGIDFLNGLVNEYINSELETRNIIAAKTVDFINEQILLMSDSLSLVEAELESFKKDNTKVSITKGGNDFLELSQELESNRKLLELNNQYLSDMKNYINSNNIGEMIIPSSVGINDINLNSAIQDLVETQLQLRSSNMNENNPLYQRYIQRISLLESNVLENIQSLTASNNRAITSIDQQLNQIGYRLKSLPTVEREFISIQRAYNLNEELYLFLMQKKAEAGIAKASNTVDYRMVDPAMSSSGPIKPKPFLNYIFAAIVGISIPVLVIFLLEFFKTRISDQEDLVSLTRIPFLGSVANYKGKNNIVNDLNANFEAIESFRIIRSNLKFMLNNEEGSKVIVITSAIAGEGKSFISQNLSSLFAVSGNKTVFIDADLRKNSSYLDLGVTSQSGLSEYLCGLVSLEEILNETKFGNLKLISSGELPPNPTELVSSEKFNHLVNHLKENFDLVIIDTPPVGILADGIEMLSVSDINIFITRQDYTPRSMLKVANDHHNKFKDKRFAILLNGVDYKASGYNSYYGKYYKRKSKKSIESAKETTV